MLGTRLLSVLDHSSPQDLTFPVQHEPVDLDIISMTGMQGGAEQWCDSVDCILSPPGNWWAYQCLSNLTMVALTLNPVKPPVVTTLDSHTIV